MLFLILVAALTVQPAADSDKRPSPPPAARPVISSPLVPPAAPATPPPTKEKGVDLRARFEVGDSFRYRFTTKDRQYAGNGRTVESTTEGEAIIEGVVKKAEPDPKTGAARMNLELRYTRIVVKTVTGTEVMSIDPATVPKNAPERAMKRLLDQVMGKTLVILLDATGDSVSLKGMPLEVFGGIAEYQHGDDLRAAGVERTAAAYEYLSSLGTASMMGWLPVLFKPGEGPPEKATVGQRWAADGDAGILKLELAEVQGDNAIVRHPAGAGGNDDSLPPKDDPLRLPTRFVWDTKAHRLVLWEESFDSLTMKGGGDRSVSSWRFELMGPMEKAKP